MRIQLAEKDQGRRKRPKGKRRGSRRSQTFNTALVLPPARARTLEDLGRSAQPRPQATRSRSRTRQRRTRWREQATAPEGIVVSPPAVRIRWRAVLARMPLALVLGVLVGGIAYASTDARFFVYEAQIVGARHLPAQAIYEAAGVHEQNIFWVQPQAVARRIIQMEGIRAVRVRCSLPAQVAIEVEEREPVAMWRASSQQQDWWLDEEGILLPYHGDVNLPDTIFVLDSSERQLKVGDRIEPEGIVRSVQQLARALAGIRIFFYDADKGLSFTQQVDGGQWPVYVGSSEDLSRKIQVVRALTDYLTTHNVCPRYVDVRWADHPVYGKSGGG